MQLLNGAFRLGADGQVSPSDDSGGQNLTSTGVGNGRLAKPALTLNELRVFALHSHRRLLDGDGGAQQAHAYRSCPQPLL